MYLKVIKRAEAHLQLATKEQSYYHGQVEASKHAVREHFTRTEQLQLPAISACLPPASNDIAVHYSFDMAQQVCKSN